MKAKNLLVFATLAFALVLSACGGAEGGTSSAVLTQAAQIYSDSLTQTAQAAPPTSTPTVAAPTATNTPVAPTVTPSVTGTPPTATASPTQQQSSGGNTGGGGNRAGCYRAAMNYESPKDGAVFEIGENFKKTWIMKNVGTCTWAPGLVLRFVEGELMGAKASIEVNEEEILPGESVTIEVTFVAPDTEGNYTGYWMLQSADGVIFGLEADGRAWFWVQITVVD